MDKETAEKILQETQQGYDFMADKFSQTRKHFWRGLESIAEYAEPGDKVLDFGCGNGRLLELIGGKQPEYYGTDISQKLIDLAKQRYPQATFSKTNPSPHTKAINSSDFSVNNNDELTGEVYLKDKASQRLVRGVQTSLPYADGFFNTIYSIAVFHHFPLKNYRQDAARELYRVTKPEGRIIITVWNIWQKRYIKNIIKNWFNKIIGRSVLDWNDCYISFANNNGDKFQRFHHAFTRRELKRLFSEAGFKIESCEIIGGRNILLIGKK